ncbi:hypothetical protein J7L18_02320 [Candidatus Bathyarchaeota archaeon]|nr:hypothetical protein [Candidatus Bathyarchaeota archaeon]
MGMKVAEGIVGALERLGVNLMFGIIGSQTSPLYDALYSSRIRHVLVRHEQMAAYMADAYAKFTGRDWSMRWNWRAGSDKPHNWNSNIMDG